jgi:hypothetical protein
VFQRLLGTTATSWKNQIWQSMETIIIYWYSNARKTN